jgi:energy-converting hydrogenase Eha subunit E
VIALLVSSGAAEIVLITLAVASGPGRRRSRCLIG